MKIKINKKEASESLSHKVIFAFMAILVLFIEAISTLLSSLQKGIYRKEILSKKSNLGFDLKIIMKD